MSDITTEQFAQRLFDCSLVDARQLNSIFSELGTRDVPLDSFQQLVLRRELVTNWQWDRIAEGHVNGFYYGDYKVLYLVGAGTFARVYRAMHKKTGEVRAVKVLRRRYTDDLDTIHQFQREAETVIPLRHPNIVRIHEVEAERDRLYMVMDFVEGQNLRDFVRIHKKLPLRNALSIGMDVASGLDYAFQRGIAHRDLKLSNVLLSIRGRASLVDFGLAAAAQSKQASAENMPNPRSIDYAGLERASGVRRDDKRSDLFFLGCMLYHMISGKPALYETKERVQRLSITRFRDIAPITVHEPNLPHRVVVLLKKCMSLDPAQRFDSPKEIYHELKATVDAIDSGEVERYNAGQEERDQYLAKMRRENRQEGAPYTLMLIESHIKIQDALRKRLKRLGYKVLIFSDPNRAMQRFADRFDDAQEDYPADCVIFGCGDLGEESLEAFNAFATSPATMDVPAILITDETQAKYADDAKLAEHRIHIQLPLKFRNLRAQLRKLLQIQSPETA